MNKCVSCSFNVSNSGSDEGLSPKFVDKLVKTYTQQGQEEWVLIHIEVQGYRDPDFAQRMFTYFYRILDKYGKPVTAIAVFTDSNRAYHPRQYTYEFLGTRNVFTFNTYKIIAQDEASLMANPNPFALVVLTVLVALKKKQLDDENLYELKFSLARLLLVQKLPRQKISDLLTFLKYYVRFANPAYSIKFEESIATLSNKPTSMGIQEMILDRARKEGLKQGYQEGIGQGIEKGIEQGIEKGIEQGKTEVVKRLISILGLSDAQAADIANVPLSFVEAIRQELGK